MSVQKRLDAVEDSLKQIDSKTRSDLISVPKEQLRKHVIRAELKEINGFHYLIEQYESGDLTVNGRSKTTPTDCQYMNYKGEWYLAKQVKNQIGTILGYETPIGYLDENSFPMTLDGKPVHVMVRVGTYELLVQDYEDFRAGKHNNGEYNEANRIFAIIKNGKTA